MQIRGSQAHLLSQFQGVLPPICRLVPQPVAQAGNLLQYEPLLQQAVLLLLHALMQLTDLGAQLILAGDDSWQPPPPASMNSHGGRGQGWGGLGRVGEGIRAGGEGGWDEGRAERGRWGGGIAVCGSY